MIGFKLDLNLDIYIYQFIEKDTRGGESYIARKFSKANNEFMKLYYKKRII